MADSSTENQVTPAATDEGTGATPKTVEVDGQRLKVEGEIDSLDGVLATLRKYQGFGKLSDIEKALGEAAQLNALNQALQQDGFDLATLPQRLKEITAKSKEEEELERQLTERYESQIKLKDIEHHKALTEAQKIATNATQELLNRKRSDTVYPMFAANAKQGAVDEWQDYWGRISRYVEFEENGSQISKILKPSGEQLFVTNQGGETTEASLTDLFARIIDGEYGFTLQNAMKPLSASTGGGLVNPSTGSAATISKGDLGKLSNDELKQARQKISTGELRVL